ncbi:MAG: DUF1501 domain-containing protein [Bryobacteraceae bacterium]
MNRRNFLKHAGCGFGYTAMAGLAAAEGPLAPRATHFPPKAKRAIFLFMSGGPSQHETFDHNPEIESAGRSGGNVLAPVFRFERRGRSGLPISEVFPRLGEHADDLCLLNGMHTDSPAHPQATTYLHTGSFTFVRPSMGAWTIYGLGTENQDLPGFITLNPAQQGGAQNYGSAFLPATYQGTPVTAEPGKQPIANIRGTSSEGEQRRQLDLVQQMNREFLERSRVDPELEGLIESYELAFRMQTSVPGVVNINREPDSVKEMYGLRNRETRGFGMQCLLARRMAEAGVRFIELHHGGWDQHRDLKARIKDNATAIDQPIAALLTDLKQRGLFHDTLVVWGGEFGRTSWAQGPEGDGRQHDNRGYTMWMAGGGVKGGIRHGVCDVNGAAVEGRVHLHDLHATMLHLLGLDHTRLTYKYAGRNFRLTDVSGRVVSEILA